MSIPTVFSYELAPGIDIRLAKIQPGRFFMGSFNGMPLEQPVREVVITQPFLLGIYPVTQNQWTAVMGGNPSKHVGDSERPVENVSWIDAVAFCVSVSALTSLEFRLPSEAEWEYACRAGNGEEYFFGDNAIALLDYGWYEINSMNRTHRVGRKRPNTWGLYDMAGNVWEWCADTWHSDYTGAPTTAAVWNDTQITQPRRVLRGGSWNHDSFRCRSAYRSREWNEFATDHFGFRVAVTL
jgi:formylglycine-generating enzyme required for sulfatase activity